VGGGDVVPIQKNDDDNMRLTKKTKQTTFYFIRLSLLLFDVVYLYILFYTRVRQGEMAIF